MTVSSQVNRKDYTGNGSTTAFATEFRFLVDTDLKVILTVDSTGVETDQILTTDYDVTGAGDDSGGTVTMIVPPATGETLTIKRDAPLTQNTEYVENDDFPAKSHERALDKLTMNMQQQQEEIDRSLKLSEGQTSTGLTIPAPDTGKFLQWDVSGNFINVDLLNQGLLIVTAFGQSLISAVDAAAGRLIMGSAKKISTAVTDNIVTFDSDDEAQDSGIPVAALGNELQVSKTDIASTSSSTFVDLPGITVNITPTKATSRVMVTVVLMIANTTSTAGSFVQILRGATVLDVGDAAGSRLQASLASGSVTGEYPYAVYNFIDSPNSTSEQTYKAQWASQATFVAVLNRRTVDSDSAAFARTVSSITVREIL